MDYPLHPGKGELPTLAANRVGAGHVIGRATHPGGEGIWVQVRVLWADGVVDLDHDGQAVAWTRDHVYVHSYGRGGEWWWWFPAEDVRRA